MKPYSFLFLFFVCASLVAQRRNVDMAKDVAFQFLSQQAECTIQNGSSLKSINMDNKIRREQMNESGQAFYIFADTVESKTVIVSGDLRMKDILAYCSTSDWQNTPMPDALQLLLLSYQEQFNLLEQYNLKENSAKTRQLPTLGPLLVTEWDQSSPYNNLAPDKCPAGCVAIAMSQIMNYYKYPNVGRGSFSYISRTNKYRESYRFDKPGFAWEDIKNSYSAFTSNECKDAVANLVYGCGVSVGMDYTRQGSGAYMSDVPYALISFWNYNKNVSYRYRPYYKTQEWYDLMLNELENGRPILYGGVDANSGGHAFVIDGCSSKYNKFHVNWGWGGDFDGYFELEALDPNRYSFSSYQDMVVNFSPFETGEYEEIFYANSFKSSGKIELEYPVSCVLSEVCCYSSKSSYVVSDTKFNGRIGIALFDSVYNYMRTLDFEDVNDLRNFYGFKKLSFDFILNKKYFSAPGRYYIAPFVEGRNEGNLTRIRTLNGETDCLNFYYTGDTITNPDINDTERVLAWSEDFENITLPKGWGQETTHGHGSWNSVSPIMPTESLPSAYSGKKYMNLKFDTSTVGFGEDRIVSYLETDYIPLSGEYQYTLSFFSRCFCEDINPTNTLSIYYIHEGSWIKITTMQISNQSLWMRQSVELPAVKDLKLRFEGSLSKGSNLCLDLVEIGIRDDPDDISHTSLQEPRHSDSIYTLSGQKVNGKQKGIYVVGGKKVLVK